MKPVVLCAVSLLVLTLVAFQLSAGPSPAVDPGPRVGATGTTCVVNGVTIVGTGCPVAGLSTGATTDETTFFNNTAGRFVSPEGVANGLGPTFNGNSCGICHSQPAIGGTSPSVNPQVALAGLMNAKNTVPSFVTASGPIREARFKYFYDRNGRPDRDNPDGGVHDLFTIAGRTDAPAGCVYPQEDFNKALNTGNVVFRIPTPVFGGGLIDAIDDATILNSHAATAAARRILDIRGRPNRSGNDGTITKFGWKAQNKSLLMFAHEAYSVELGESNQMFPQKRGFGGVPPPASCLGNPLPEDFTNYLPDPNPTELVPSDDDSFATFMRFLDQPTPACTGSGCSASIQNGLQQFTKAGCSLCHTPSMTTTPVSAFAPAALANVQANLFSDLMLHHMGSGLADGISQGLAGPDEFRSSPLWGIGQRLFFLHDGRCADLVCAIQAHKSPGSEANRSTDLFNFLSPSDQQDLLNFLRSL